MRTFRITFIALALLFAGACSQDDPETRATATTVMDNEAGMPGGVVLGSGGVTAVHAEGTENLLPFGSDAAEVEEELRIILGDPGTEAPVVDCSAGVEPQQVVWPGFVMLSLDGRFAGWAATEKEYAVVERGQRITIGSPLALVEEYLGPLDLAQSPRGFEFVLRDNDVTTYAGAFPSNEPTAPLIAFAAGLNCFAR